ncbi:MAG: HNH endonuclease [Planctomycetota bacterium]|nr:HNH endonuclease [Planctomycetota bacterium]
MKRRTDEAMTKRAAKPEGRRPHPGTQPAAGELPPRVTLGRRGRQAEDAELLEDMRRAAKRLGKGRLGASGYRRLGGYSPTTVVRRFGSWNAAVERAGLALPPQVSDEELLADLRRVARRLRQEHLSQADYNLHGRYDYQRAARRFGSWGKAVERAGLGATVAQDIDPNELFYNILAVWLKLGRRPSSAEMRRPLSKFSIRPYIQRFGTWRKALAAFFEWLHELDPPGAEGGGEPRPLAPGTILVRPTERDLPRVRAGHKTPRKPSVRQRFRVMLRDDFRCRLCGRSPATQHGLELHVDHVIAWSKGGETVDENLQTLCSDCNLGKFDR